MAKFLAVHLGPEQGRSIVAPNKVSMKLSIGSGSPTSQKARTFVCQYDRDDEPSPIIFASVNESKCFRIR
jgi:hypothetical protein